MTNPQPADVVGMRLNLGGSRDAVEQLKCIAPPVGCGREITLIEIARWDGLSQKEYTQSGWCKECQDKVFKDPDEPEECTHEGKCEDFWANPDIEKSCICTCNFPCCEADVGIGILTCGSQHCRVHGGKGEAQTA